MNINTAVLKQPVFTGSTDFIEHWLFEDEPS
ncbi:hypothetical protein LA635_p1044 (plasmid) [Erwinia amylovora LA635]|nr:hypothetical protein predicted by Glimmer/Critica [Erwinia amylovora ATCC BAA-2158]CCO84439.1 hypothetical protein BN433_pEA290032 [Erwinia amylovora Ea266]CDK23777.1 hypothetical protein LA635_p1044 [Erwinia amylovora LA635]CDK23820.1 hypothetical protein LA636_p1042 [Erwinia amylovora LA636]CDK23871.1 hypothetical protein LA637_p1044 [Erwinia amylovora LA637]